MHINQINKQRLLAFVFVLLLSITLISCSSSAPQQSADSEQNDDDDDGTEPTISSNYAGTWRYVDTGASVYIVENEDIALAFGEEASADIADQDIPEGHYAISDEDTIAFKEMNDDATRYLVKDGDESILLQANIISYQALSEESNTRSLNSIATGTLITLTQEPLPRLGTSDNYQPPSITVDSPSTNPEVFFVEVPKGYYTIEIEHNEEIYRSNIELYQTENVRDFVVTPQNKHNFQVEFFLDIDQASNEDRNRYAFREENYENAAIKITNVGDVAGRALNITILCGELQGISAQCNAESVQPTTILPQSDRTIGVSLSSFTEMENNQVDVILPIVISDGQGFVWDYQMQFPLYKKSIDVSLQSVNSDAFLRGFLVHPTGILQRLEEGRSISLNLPHDPNNSSYYLALTNFNVSLAEGINYETYYGIGVNTTPPSVFSNLPSWLDECPEFDETQNQNRCQTLPVQGNNSRENAIAVRTGDSAKGYIYPGDLDYYRLDISPENIPEISLSEITTTGFSLVWSAVEDATYYVLYQNELTLISDQITSTSYIYEGYELGTELQLLIQACNDSGCSEGTDLIINESGQASYPQISNIALQFTSVSTSAVNLSIDITSDALTSLTLYRESIESEDYLQTVIPTVGQQIFVESSLLPETTYAYFVQLCIESNCVVSGPHEITTEAPAPESPSLAATPIHTKQNYIVWSSVPYADEYILTRNNNEVYRGSLLFFYDTADTDWDGETLSYTLIACHSGTNCSDETIVSVLTLESPETLPAPTVEQIVEGNGLFIEWSGSSDLYLLERSSVAAFTEATQIYHGTVTSYTDFDLVSGQTYYYRVYACQNSYCPSPSPIATYGFVFAEEDFIPHTPEWIQAEIISPTQNRIEWGEVSNLDEYKLYQYDGTEQLIYQGTNTEHLQTISWANVSVLFYRLEACNAQGCSNQIETILINPAFDQFFITSQYHSHNSDWDSGVNEEFGLYYQVADWSDLETFDSDGYDLAQLFDFLGIEETDDFFITYNSEQYTSDSESYVATRNAENSAPVSPVYENLTNDLVTLRSVSNGNKRILVTASTDTFDFSDFIFLEEFTNYEVSTLPSDYVIVNNGGGSIEQYVDIEGGNNYLRTIGEANNNLIIKRDLSVDLPDRIIAYFSMKAHNDVHTYPDLLYSEGHHGLLGGISIKNSDQKLIESNIIKLQSNNQFYLVGCTDGVNNNLTGSSVQINLGQWYSVVIEADFPSNQQTMYVDGESVCSSEIASIDLPDDTWTENAGIQFISGNAGATQTNFDNIAIQENLFDSSDSTSILSLLYPSDGEQNVPLLPTFRWEESTDNSAESYYFEIGFFIENIFNTVSSSVLTTNQHTLNEQLESLTQYRWSVSTIDNNGLISTPAIATFLTIDSTQTEEPTAPNLLYPEDTQTDIPLLPTFRWETSTDNSIQSYSFEISIFVNSDDTFYPLSSTTLTANQHTLNEPLEPLTQYRWSVVAIDNNGIMSTPTIHIFTTTDSISTNDQTEIENIIFELSDGSTIEGQITTASGDIQIDLNLAQTLTFDSTLSISSLSLSQGAISSENVGETLTLANGDNANIITITAESSNQQQYHIQLTLSDHDILTWQAQCRNHQNTEITDGTQISNAETLLNIDLGQTFYLTQNINLARLTNNWSPIGSAVTSFNGRLEGNCYIVYNLTINDDSAGADYQGLFAQLNNATVNQLGIGVRQLNANAITGGLAGEAVGGTTMTNIAVAPMTSTSIISVNGSALPDEVGYAGGVLGRMSGAGNNLIAHNYNLDVQALENSGGHIGGLVGNNSFGDITGSASGNFSSSVNHNSVGGLVGYLEGGTVTGSASGSVTGNGSLGGLVGLAFSRASVTGSASVDIFARPNSTNAGGLVGINNQSTATGSASGNIYGNQADQFGGLIGHNYQGTVIGYALGWVKITLPTTQTPDRFYGCAIAKAEDGTSSATYCFSESDQDDHVGLDSSGATGTLRALDLDPTNPSAIQVVGIENAASFMCNGNSHSGNLPEGTLAGEWDCQTNNLPKLNLPSEVTEVLDINHVITPEPGNYID